MHGTPGKSKLFKYRFFSVAEKQEQRIVVIYDPAEIRFVQIGADRIRSAVRKKFHDEHQRCKSEQHLEDAQSDAEDKSAGTVDERDRPFVVLLGQKMHDHKKHDLHGKHEDKK